MASIKVFLSAALLASWPATATAAVSGRVITPEGQPVAGATVTAYALETANARAERLVAGQERRGLLSAKSGSDGSFRLDVAESLFAVGVRADGFAPAMATTTQGETVVVTASPARTRRGTIAAAGKPAAGATMAWMSNLTDPQSAELVMRAGPDGAYDVPDPDEWASSVLVFHPEAAPFHATPSPAWAPSLAFEMKAGVRLEGQVTDARSGGAAAGAAVWLDGWPRARSGADGAFVIPHADSGWAHIVARTSALAGTGKKAAGRIAIALHPSRRITGTVRDAGTRQPLAGVTVALWDDRRVAAGSTITDARGQYVVGTLPPGRYWPYAMRAGFANGSPDGMTEPLDVRKAAAASHDFDLVAQRRVAVRVQDAGGKPVEGALLTIGFDGMGTYYGDVSALMDGAAGDVRHFTGADGTFSLPIPDYVQEASKSANMPASVVALKAGYAAGRARIPASAQTGPLVIPLPKGLPLRGRVVGLDGAPLSEVAVAVLEPGTMLSLQTMRGAELPPWVRTDAQGVFAAQVLAARHQLLFRKAGYAPRGVENADPRGGQDLAVVLEPGASLRGRVVRSDGRGVADASLFLIDHSTPPTAVDSAVTGKDGSFEFTDLAPASYEMRIEHGATGVMATRTVQAPGRDLRVELAPTAVVRGRVVDAATRAPIPRFWLSFARDPRQALGSDAPGERGEAIDAADGAFVVEDVPVGESVLTVQAEGYRAKRVQGLAVSAEPGAPDVEVALDAGATLRGRVTDSDGEPLPDASVAVRGGDGNNATAATDEAGDYEVKALAPGESTVVVSRSGYRSVRRTLDPQQAKTLDVSLTRGSTITGIVLYEEAGVPKARVVASSGTLDADSQNAVTDSAGRFTLQGLAPGRYNVTAWTADKGKAELKDVDIATAGPLRLVIDPSPRAVLVGTVIGLREMPDGRPPMVAVRVMSAEGRSAMALADASGAFRVEDAPAGRVTVTAASMSPAGTRTSQSNELTLQAGAETTTVLEFKEDFVVSGRVIRAGTALPDASVAFHSGERGATASTDREGRYEVTLAAGEYRVSVTSQNVYFQTEHAVAGSGSFDIDVTGGGLRGRAVEAGTETPVAGAGVSLWHLGGRENTPASTLTTSDQGAFDAPTLREGRYRIVTSKKGFGQQVHEVEVRRGSSADILIELQPAEGVTVTVTDARDGRALEAIVVVRDAERRIVANRHAGADAEGAVTVPLVDGPYLLSTSATGYGTATLPIRAPARGLRVALTPGGTLVIESPRAISGRIRLIQPDGEEYVRCWCNGIAEIKLEGRRTTVENVAPGSYTMELVDAPGQAFSRAIVVQEGQTTTVTID